jgi:hypothetical protein
MTIEPGEKPSLRFQSVGVDRLALAAGLAAGDVGPVARHRRRGERHATARRRRRVGDGEAVVGERQQAEGLVQRVASHRVLPRCGDHVRVEHRRRVGQRRRQGQHGGGGGGGRKGEATDVHGFSCQAGAGAPLLSGFAVGRCRPCCDRS